MNAGLSAACKFAGSLRIRPQPANFRLDKTHPSKSISYVMPGKPRRFILLALKGSHIDPRLLSSASSLCGRLDAGLDIMLVSAEGKLPPLLDNFMRELQQGGIYCRLMHKAALRSREIVQYANTHECITTVLIDSQARWMAPEDEKRGNSWRKLGCPLVVMPD